MQKRSRTPATGPTDEDLLALAAAWLHCQESKEDKNEGLKQADIAERLGIKQPTVSRVLTHAKERGWLRTKPQLGAVPAGWLEKGRERHLSLTGLREHIHTWGEDIRCEPTVFFGSPEDFYRQAAAHV